MSENNNISNTSQITLPNQGLKTEPNKLGQYGAGISILINTLVVMVLVAFIGLTTFASSLYFMNRFNDFKSSLYWTANDIGSESFVDRIDIFLNDWLPRFENNNPNQAWDSSKAAVSFWASLFFVFAIVLEIVATAFAIVFLKKDGNEYKKVAGILNVITNIVCGILILCSHSQVAKLQLTDSITNKPTSVPNQVTSISKDQSKDDLIIMLSQRQSRLAKMLETKAGILNASPIDKSKLERVDSAIKSMQKEIDTINSKIGNK